MDFPFPRFPFVTDEERKMMLLQAAHSGNLRVLKEQARKLNKGKGVAETIKDIECPEGHNVFSIAALKGKRNICQYLVEELRFPVDFVVKNGETPLILAAKEGRVSTARYLMDHGADPTYADREFCTPLHRAAENGHDEVVDLLLSRGVPVDLEINPAIGTPLHFAAQNGQESTMKILLEHKANVNKIVNGILTPLLVCITVGSFKCVKILIEAGADPNLKCALGRAISEGDIRTVKCMLKAGANPNSPDELGFLPIETAAMADNKEVVEMLLPLTAPIPKLQNWTAMGIIRHVNTNAFRKKAERRLQKNSAEQKKKGDDAFRKKEYTAAISFYSSAMMTSSTEDAVLYSNRSLCWLRIGDGKAALEDAQWAAILRPSWSKVHYRVGAAYMTLKEYDQACHAFMNALKLDPTNEELEKAFWEAHYCMEEARNHLEEETIDDIDQYLMRLGYFCFSDSD